MSGAAVEIVTPRESCREAARRFSAAKLREGFKPAALHRWRDAEGITQYFRIRLKHPDGRKWLRPFYLNAEGEYVLGEPPAPAGGKLLYNLPALVAADPATPVFIVEGENCADALAKLGIVATTSGGASSAGVSDWVPLRGRNVTIWPDNDEAGLKYGATVADKLRGLGCAVRVLSPEIAEALPKGGDYVDWLTANPEATEADVLALPTVAPVVAEAGTARPQALTRRLADIKREPLAWLWPGRLPLGKVSMLVGDPGLGKSLVTLGIAATVSRGGRWPIHGEGEAPAGDVVLVSGEDDPADTIRPRLEAAGADLARVHVLDGVEYTGDTGERLRRTWSLADMPELERLIESLPGCKLLIVDPVSAYLAGTDSHKNADVRALLLPLADMAARYRLAVLAVSHLNKSQGPAIYRTTGSLAFTAAARSVYCVTKDNETPRRRLVVPIKANLAPDATGIAYQIGTDETGTPWLEWEPAAFEVDANEALATPSGDSEGSATDDCVDWLRDELKGGPRPVKEIKSEAREADYSAKVLRRARERLGIKPKKQDFSGGWVWELPTKMPQDAQGAHQKERAPSGHEGTFGEEKAPAAVTDAEGFEI